MGKKDRVPLKRMSLISTLLPVSLSKLASWHTTGTPSAVSWMSSSRISVLHVVTACRNASMVFSRFSPAPPRWDTWRADPCRGVLLHPLLCRIKDGTRVWGHLRHSRLYTSHETNATTSHDNNATKCCHSIAAGEFLLLIKGMLVKAALLERLLQLIIWDP